MSAPLLNLKDLKQEYTIHSITRIHSIIASENNVIVTPKKKLKHDFIKKYLSTSVSAKINTLYDLKSDATKLEGQYIFIHGHQ